MSERVGEKAGWGFPGAARKAHYFEDGEIISVCRKWMYSGPLTVNQNMGEKPGPDDCVACFKIAKKKAASV